MTLPERKTVGGMVGCITISYADFIRSNRNRVEVLAYEKSIGLKCSVRTLEATTDLLDTLKELRMNVQNLIDELQGNVQ